MNWDERDDAAPKHEFWEALKADKGAGLLMAALFVIGIVSLLLTDPVGGV